MATVIRSAQIAGEAVTLAVASCAVPGGLSASPSTMPAAGGTCAEPRPTVMTAQAPEQGNDDDTVHASRMREEQLHDREKQLQERENQAQEYAQRLQDECAAERQKAREAAYDEGYQHGEEEGRNAYRDRLTMLQDLITSLKEEFAGEIAGLEDVVVDIAFEAICKIVGRSLHERDGVRAVVQEVASRAKDQEKLVLRVSPRDYALLHEDGDALAGVAQGIKHELVPDDRVVLGGCMIETAGGTIDGRLEIQLQQLRETLVSARKMLPE